jgi:hypothetical protein
MLVVHVLDKQFGFLFTIVKGSIPKDFAVDGAVLKSTPCLFSRKGRVARESKESLLRLLLTPSAKHPHKVNHVQKYTHNSYLS